MKTATTTHRMFGQPTGILILVLLTAQATASPPEDPMYVGGPESDPATSSVSETWRLRNEDVPPVPLPDVHPFKGHGANDNDDDKLDLEGVRITLHNRGNQWFLVPQDGLGWTPLTIPLQNHPLFDPWGSADQWRWISVPPVKIDSHEHVICVGYLDLKNTSRRDDDELKFAVVDRSNPPTDPDCGTPDPSHPGHAGADR